MKQMRGVDVSYANGRVDFEALKEEGIEFAIIRLGYGNRHLDDYFFVNFNGAIDAGLKVGVYYYSYALTEEDAKEEAKFTLEILQDSGITPDVVPMGVWFDMEDADGYKERNGMPDDGMLNQICNTYFDFVGGNGYSVGLYASFDWLFNILNYEDRGVQIWNAEWGEENDLPEAAIWQYTDCEIINGQQFDGDICFVEE